MRLWVYPVLMSMALAACASKPPVAQLRAPMTAPAKASFAISSAAAKADAPAPAVEVLVAEALVRRGLRPVAVAEADYRVQVAFADRPMRTGALVPVEGATAPIWLEPGLKPRVWTPMIRGVYALRVRITEAKTGAVAYDASVSRSHRKAVRPDEIVTLVDAALKPLS